MSEEELVVLVRRIMESDGAEEEVCRMMRVLESSVPHPGVSDLIFWNEGGDLTAEEVVRRALAYQPMPLPPSSIAPADGGEREES